MNSWEKFSDLKSWLKYWLFFLSSAVLLKRKDLSKNELYGYFKEFHLDIKKKFRFKYFSSLESLWACSSAVSIKGAMNSQESRSGQNPIVRTAVIKIVRKWMRKNPMLYWIGHGQWNQVMKKTMSRLTRAYHRCKAHLLTLRLIKIRLKI